MELHLKRGEELLGVLHRCQPDFPWFMCSFEAGEGFSQVKQFFDEELELLESDEIDQWEIAYERINALGLKLIDTETNQLIDEFILHIRGTEAWFRY